MSEPDRHVDGWDVIARAQEMAARGEEFALATVVWRQGPSSGGLGSRAIVTATGQMYGWIGGACAEPTVLREARQAIVDREPRLLLLGTAEQFGGAIPEGMTVVPISCGSEGALQVYVEPVVTSPHVVVVGRSPMAGTLVELAAALGWRADLVDAPDFASTEVDHRSVVVVATQGHGDEEAVERAARAQPSYVGLVASRRRGEAVLGYLAERGVPQPLLDRVRVPVGLDLGHTSHREIAVAVLAELVALRARGGLVPGRSADDLVVADALASVDPAEAVDPVCGMTVAADRTSRSLEHAGTTYYFCCPGCRDAFEKDPAAYLPTDARC
jgi:xanthine dehydrogenase accessory factor